MYYNIYNRTTKTYMLSQSLVFADQAQHWLHAYERKYPEYEFALHLVTFYYAPNFPDELKGTEPTI